MKEKPPTDAELVKAVDDLFYAAHQSAIFAYWRLIEVPVCARFNELGIPEAKQYFHNGFLEGALMFIRKTVEFFKAKEKNDRNDTLYAYRYLSVWSGTPIVSEEIYKELHKRVGHITVRESRQGKMQWSIFEMTLNAIRQWIEFFENLPQSAVFEGNPPQSRISKGISALREVLRGCEKIMKN